MKEKFSYDLVSIGSGPGGQKAAIQAAKLGKRVAIVDANPLVGGVCLHDGTIPSKSFREAIMHLSGYKERSHYGKREPSLRLAGYLDESAHLHR